MGRELGHVIDHRIGFEVQLDGMGAFVFVIILWLMPEMPLGTQGSLPKSVGKFCSLQRKALCLQVSDLV